MRRRYDVLEDQPDTDAENLEPIISRSSIYSIPFYVGIIILGFLGSLYSSVYLIDNTLPNPLTIADEENFPNSFIAERAIHDLKLLTSVGPRITGGYENEVLAVDFLKREINFIIQQAHPNQKIELDLQVVSGSYNLELLFVDQINAYSHVQNVIVKLYGNNESNNSVLVNSHFDSVPTSPGGSDDGINVVAMLEILRKLSKSSERLKHNVIFLFNGAEETPLQSAHGFVTQHPWANECKVVVNLEACGAGGKIILFQSGPETPWLMKYYSKVPHPYGQAAGEEIFQSGLIPSDTDFRIFRDFKGLVGVDMAFYKNGYRYHTKYDDFTHIPPGSYQHVGDNALSLVKNLANAPELEDPVPSPGKLIYFDILGWFMVSYTTYVATIINLMIVTLSLFTFAYSIVDFKLKGSESVSKFVIKTFGALLGSWITTGLSVCVIAYFIDLAGSAMSWYAHPLLITGLYVAPTIALSGCLFFLTNSKNFSENIKCHIQAHVVRLVWTLILLVGTVLQIRTVYAMLVPVLFNSVGFIVIHAFRWQHTVRRWQIIYLVTLIIPTILLMYHMLVTLSLFIPLMGRIGSDKNPDVIIGIMIVFFTILITSPYVALITLIRDPKSFFLFLGAIFVTCFVVALTPLGFPYRGDFDNPAPQRQWLLHTKRLFHNEQGKVERTDAGIFFLNLDRNSPNILKKYIPDLGKAKSLEEDCKNYLLCGLPLSHAKMTQVMKYSTWIPANQPVIHEPMTFKLLSKEQINSTLLRYNITASGPDRLAIYMVPKTDMKVVAISLVDSLKQPQLLHNGRPLYFILHTYGKYPADLSFTFDVEVPPNFKGTTVDIAVTAKYVHDNKVVRTPYYLSILKQFPEWADVTPGLGCYSSYIL